MKKVLALGLLATAFSMPSIIDASSGSGSFNQINWNTSQTFLRFETPFQSASPERLALFNTEDKREKHRAAHNGDVQFVVFGGQNTSQRDAAAYYMPGGLETLYFNASIDNLNSGTDTAMTVWSGAQGGITRAQIGNGQNTALGRSSGTAGQGNPFTIGTSTTAGSFSGINDLAVALGSSSATDLLNQSGPQAATTTTANQFAVGTGVAGAYNTYDLTTIRGLVDNTSNIGDQVIDTNKNIGIMRPWNFGVGYAPNVQFGLPISESAFLSAITPELKRSYWAIGATWKQLLSTKDTGFFLELSTVLQSVTMHMNLNEFQQVDLSVNPETNDEGYAGTWSGQGFDMGNATAPTTMTQAFAQDAWLYGKVNGAQSVTRLADIELKLGYQFICEENVMSNFFVGLVIPTGNKAQSVYLAEPIVGNGFHFGLMLGSTQEIQLDMGSETRWSMRSDSNFRYLFQNTQTRSFDTTSNGQWSRYMMVWENYADEQAFGEMGTTENALRQFTPGINVFTQEVYVSPGAQARINEALVVEHGSFKAEFGWNLMVRQAEKVSLVNEWNNNSIAFVDASNQSVSMFNATRTIYNDSYQSTPVATGTAGASEEQYNASTISLSDLNIDGAASPTAFTNAPYLALGYAFNEEKSSVVSIGASYEMSATNSYINSWNLWGKFGFSF